MKTPCKILIPRLASSFAALMALALATGSALAVDGTWAGNSSGNWSDASKWVDGIDVDLLGDIPDGAGATADLANVTLASSNKSVTLDSIRTIGILKLGASGRNLDLNGPNILTLDGNGGNAEITFRSGGRNGSTGVAIELKSNLLITNPDSGGNNGILISGGLSSSGGNLTITNNSNNNSRTKFNSTVSDGASGNTITYIQTVGGWTEFNNTNTFTGTTTNGAGTMILGNSLALQNSALDTTGSITGTASVGLRVFGAGVTSLTFGGLVGDKNINAAGTGVFNSSVGLYSQITALTLNPGTGKSHSYSGVIENGAANMTLAKTGAGTQSLNGINTFTGATNVNVGTLKLDTLGALDAASSVSIAAGATFDLTAKTAASATYTWNTTSLSASGAATPATITGTALGTIDMGIKPISLTTDAMNPSLTVTGAALSLGGNTFTVVVPGPALGVGVYTLVSASSITGTVNATASYTGGNGLAGGTTGVVSLSGGNTVILTVTGGSLETIVASPTALPASLITTYPTASASESVAVSGSNLIANITATAQTNFEVSDDNVTFGPTVSYTQSGGNVSSTPLYVRLAANASAAGSYDNITAAILTSGSATPVNVTTAVSGNSVAKASPTVTVTVGSYTYNASPQGPTAYTTSPTGDTGAPTWSYAGIFPTIYGASPALPTLPGTYSATVSLAADPNFNAASSSATAFAINGGNITVTGSLTPFTTTVGTASTAQNVSVSGTSLTGNITATAPTGFEVSADGFTYAPTATYTQGGGNASGTLFVRLTAAAAVGSYPGNVVLTSAATPSVSVPASGTVNPNPGDGIWILNGSDNWSNNTTAWLGNFIADGVGGTAHFTTNFSSNRTVTLDSNRTLGILNLSVTGRTLTIDPSGGSILTLDNTGSTAAQINMTTAQNMNVNVPVALNDSLVINQNVSNGSGKDLQLGVISSTNGSLTIEHKSTFTDGQTRFLGDISNGSGTIAFTQTSGRSIFTAANSYTGPTAINGGTLSLGAGGALAATTNVSIAAGATFDLTTPTAASATYIWNANSLSASGAATPATITGTALGTIAMGVKPISLTTNGTNPSLTVTGAALSLGGNQLTVVVPGPALTAGVYTLISGASITGTVNATALYTGGNGLAGGTIGVVSLSGGNTVILTVTAGSAYVTWANVNAPTGNPDEDFDGDCVSNAVEFVLGGDKDTNDLDKLPVIDTDGTDMTFSFERDQTSIAAGTTVTIEVSTDLVNWNALLSPYAVSNSATGVVNPGVTVLKDSPAPGTDKVTLTIPMAPGTKKFARLKVVITP